jgi:hypothetical protein
MAKITYTVAASFERDGQVVDCSQHEILGAASGAEYRSEKRAIEAAEEAQEAIDDAIREGYVDSAIVVSVYKGRTQVWSARAKNR